MYLLSNVYRKHVPKFNFWQKERNASVTQGVSVFHGETPSLVVSLWTCCPQKSEYMTETVKKTLVARSQRKLMSEEDSAIVTCSTLVVLNVIAGCLWQIQAIVFPYSFITQPMVDLFCE